MWLEYLYFRRQLRQPTPDRALSAATLRSKNAALRIGGLAGIEPVLFAVTK